MLATGNIRLYAPINLTALERSNSLESWLKEWLLPKTILLTPAQWFIEAHDLRFVGNKAPQEMMVERGCYLWTPQPIVADIAIEQLRQARLKRHSSIHVMIIPKLCYAMWRRQFYKAMDLILFLPPRWDFWNCDMHELLIFGFVFPFCREKPWCVRGTLKLCELERLVQAMWKESRVDGRVNLRKFLLEAWKFPGMPVDMVQRLLYFQSGGDVQSQKQADR